MKYLYLIFSNLKRKKLRTGLTILSIIVAFLLFGYLSAIRQAFAAGVEVAGADRLEPWALRVVPNLYPIVSPAVTGTDHLSSSSKRHG